MLLAARMPLIPVFEDNEGAIAIAKNPITISNSKHIDVRHHFLRELIARGSFRLFTWHRKTSSRISSHKGVAEGCLRVQPRLCHELGVLRKRVVFVLFCFGFYGDEVFSKALGFYFV